MDLLTAREDELLQTDASGQSGQIGELPAALKLEVLQAVFGEYEFMESSQTRAVAQSEPLQTNTKAPKAAEILIRYLGPSAQVERNDTISPWELERRTQKTRAATGRLSFDGLAEQISPHQASNLFLRDGLVVLT